MQRASAIQWNQIQDGEKFKKSVEARLAVLEGEVKKLKGRSQIRVVPRSK